SRIAILQRLIDFGMRWLSSLREDRKGLSLIAVALAFARVARWVGVAIFVSFRIDHGALDAPRPPKTARARRTDDLDADARACARTPPPDRAAGVSLQRRARGEGAENAEASAPSASPSAFSAFKLGFAARAAAPDERWVAPGRRLAYRWASATPPFMNFTST